jgi:sialic acid synthase SpsE
MPHEYAFGDIQPLGHWGVSDHTGELDDTVSIVAAALGAEVIEFHIADNGPVTQDHEFSLTPAAAQRRVWAARTAARMAYDMPRAFDISFARRWVAVTDIEEGDVLGPANTALYRCKEGLPADTEVWGGVATVPMCAGQPITLDVAEW